MFHFIFKALNLKSKIQAFGIRTKVMKFEKKKGYNDYSGKKKWVF